MHKHETRTMSVTMTWRSTCGQCKGPCASVHLMEVNMGREIASRLMASHEHLVDETAEDVMVEHVALMEMVRRELQGYQGPPLPLVW